MYDTENLMEALLLETRRLGDYLDSLPRESWSHPTACQHWDVATVVAHLAGAADAFSERIKRGLHGDTSASEGLPEAGDVNANTWADTNARRWRTIGENMTESPLAAFRRSGEEFNALISSLRAEEWEELCYHPGGVVPVRTLVGFRLLELVIHDWDIRSRLEESAQLSEDTLPHLTTFISDYLDWFFVPGRELDAPICYRFQFTDSNLHDYDIVVKGNDARMIKSGSEAPDVEFVCSSEVFILLMCGRISLDTSIREGTTKLSGDDNLAVLFSQWFKGA